MLLDEKARAAALIALREHCRDKGATKTVRLLMESTADAAIEAYEAAKQPQELSEEDVEKISGILDTYEGCTMEQQLNALCAAGYLIVRSTKAPSEEKEL